MPELPEVETTRRGVTPHVLDRLIVRVVVREPRLRWPVPDALAEELPGKRFTSVGRRQSICFSVRTGYCSDTCSRKSADNARRTRLQASNAHVDNVHSARGSVTDRENSAACSGSRRGSGEHSLLQGLGPEPLGDEFGGDLLHGISRGRRTVVKSLIMDSRVVAGVGNIYACEALFLAGIHPARACGRISAARYEKLAESIRLVLGEAIRAGGTSLRDFTGGDGRPGYFKQQLNVYGRVGEDCVRCSATLRESRLGQRSTVFCPSCQR